MGGKSDHRLPVFGEHTQTEDFFTDLSIFSVHFIEVTDLTERYRTFVLRLCLFRSINNRCRLFSLRQNLKALFLHILLPAVIGKHIGSAEQNTAVIGGIKVFQGNALVTDLLDLTARAVIHDNVTDCKIGHLCSFGLFLHKLLFTEELRHFGKAETVTEIRCILAVNRNDNNIAYRQTMPGEIIGTVIIELSE